MNYIPTILGALIGVCLFILPLWAYRRGIKDGLALNQGKTPEPIQNPVQSVVSHVERKHEAKKAKEEEDRVTQGLQNILAYDGSPQGEAEK